MKKILGWMVLFLVLGFSFSFQKVLAKDRVFLSDIEDFRTEEKKSVQFFKDLLKTFFTLPMRGASYFGAFVATPPIAVFSATT